jgi:hypothetical protein
MTTSNVEAERLRAAIGHLKEAQRLLGELHHDKSLWAHMRPLAEGLRVAISPLNDVALILQNPGGDHWNVATTLKSVVATLDRLDSPGVADARNAVQLAYDALVGTEDCKDASDR